MVLLASDAVTVNVNVPPSILSNLVVTPAEGGSTASISVNVNSDEGNVYFVIVPDGSAVPSGAQIEAGTDGDDTAATWSGSVEVTAIDTYVVGPTGLTALTDYVAYAVHEDLTPIYSVVVSDAFTSLDPPADPDFAITALFEAGERGAWYDYSDPEALASSSTNYASYPVLGTDGNVNQLWRAFDKTGALRTTTEKVTGADVTSWTNASWNVFTDNGDGSVTVEKTVAGGTATAYSNTMAGATFTAGKQYRVTYEVTGFTGTPALGMRVDFGSTTNARTSGGRDIIANGTYADYIIATTTTGGISFRILSSAVLGCTVRLISLEEMDAVPLLYSGTASTYKHNGQTYPYALYDTTDRKATTLPLDLSGNDNLVVFAVVERLQNAADARLLEHGSTVKIVADAPDFTNGDEYTFGDGTVALAAQSTTTPETVLLTYTRVRGGTATLRVNGVEADTGTAGSGALENATLYMFSSSVPDKIMNGKMYEVIIRNAATSTAEIEAVEARLMTKHGIA